MRSNFDNTWKLTRFMLRRERQTAIMWIVLLSAVVLGLVPGLMAIAEGDAQAELAYMMTNPALAAMVGPPLALVNDGFGALYTNLMFLFTALTVGIMNILLIVRHTRADEELGRYEVLRSLPVGRLANLSAALILAVFVNAVLSILVGLGMFVFGDASMTFNGSMLWGAGLGAAGLVFAAFAALFCQISASSRGASAYSFTVLIIFYFLRAAGDTNDSMEILSYLSPLGLANRSAPYAGDYWWPILILIALAIAVSITAYKLNAIRDIDQGIIPDREGRAEGGKLLRSSAGLSFRLLRTAIIFTLVGMFVLGASYATILDDIDDFIAQNEVYQTLILAPAGIDFEAMEGMTTEEIVAIMNMAIEYAGFTFVELYASMVNNMMALIAIVAPLLFVLRVKSEEKAMRSEMILATPAGRGGYLLGYACFSFATAVLMQFVLALGLFLTTQAILPDPAAVSFRFLVEASMAYTPAILVMTGLAVFLVGFLPKATGIVWGYYGYTALVVFIGRMGVLPSWLQRTTPIGFVPQPPADEITFLPLALLTALAAVLTFAGLYFYKRRDINAITH